MTREDGEWGMGKAGRGASKYLSGNVAEKNIQNFYHEINGFNMDRRLLGEGGGNLGRISFFKVLHNYKHIRKSGFGLLDWHTSI